MLYFETSALEGTNVHDAFINFTEKVFKKN